jgi:hypothetical protein
MTGLRSLPAILLHGAMDGSEDLVGGEFKAIAETV